MQKQGLRLFLFLWGFSLAGRGEMGNFPAILGPDRAIPSLLGEYRSIQFLNHNITRQGHDVGHSSHELMVAVPVSQTERNAVTMRTVAHASFLDGEGNLNGRPLPRQLWNFAVGTSAQHHLGDRERLGVDVSLGSASDRPFHSIDEAALQTTVSYSLPSGERNAWQFFLNYSNIRPTLNHIPLPGFGYAYNPNDELRALFGLPFASLFWRPGSWALVAVVSPFFATGQVSYAFLGPLQAYTSFIWTAQTFALAERGDKADRFFHGYKSVALGLRSPLSTFLSLELGVNYTFDRRYYEGRSASNIRGEAVSVDSGVGLTVHTRFRL